MQKGQDQMETHVTTNEKEQPQVVQILQSSLATTNVRFQTTYTIAHSQDGNSSSKTSSTSLSCEELETIKKNRSHEGFKKSYEQLMY